jgi:phage terminase small subunit
MKEITVSKQSSSSWETLNDKQKLFCLSYLQCFNATKAYKEAYPSIKSDDIAAVSGARLLRNVKVKQALQEKLDDFWQERENQAGRTLNEIMALAFSDIDNIVQIKEDTLNVKDLRAIDSRAIQSIKTTRTNDSETITVSLYNKNQALALLAKIINMVTERTEVSGTIEVIPAVRPKPVSENEVTP